MALLEIEYRPAYWVHSLLAAIQAKPALASAHSKWATSDLSDLAFTIETRLGNLPEVVRQIDENLNVLGRELEQATADIASLLAGGYAFRFEDEVALRRALIGFNSFVSESRSCFESLAKFYRSFMDSYFGQAISVPDSYAKLASLATQPTWAEDLRLVRHDILHDRSPWIAFEDTGGTPRWEPILLLSWRPRAHGPRDRVKLNELRMMRANLQEALVGLRTELITLVNAIR